jgi:S1-C subfamily serine protease
MERRNWPMNGRVWKIIALVMALLTALAVGAAIGGGIVYAAARMIGRMPQVSVVGAIDPEAGSDSGPESGIVIVRVVPDSPAAEAGVARGDILLTVDGEQVDDLHDLWGVLEGREPGEEVELTVLHGDEERVRAATLDHRNGGSFLGLMSCGDPLGMPPLGQRILGLGALIIEVTPDSPAEQAGLQVGDHIAAVEGQKVDAENDLAALIATRRAGDTVTVEIARPGEESREVTVELGEHPEEGGKAYLGVRYVPLPHIDMPGRHELPHFRMPRLHFDFDEEHFGIGPGEVQQGAIIRQVVESSPAEAAGLHKGDVITAVDGEPVENPRALVDAVGELEPGDTLTLTVVRPEEAGEREVEVTLAEDPEDEGAAYLGVMIGGFLKLRSEDGELPPRMELPDRSFRFRLPFMKEPLELDGLGDGLRHFEFRFRPWDRDGQRSNSPGDSA